MGRLSFCSVVVCHDTPAAVSRFATHLDTWGIQVAGLWTTTLRMLRTQINN